MIIDDSSDEVQYLGNLWMLQPLQEAVQGTRHGVAPSGPVEVKLGFQGEPAPISFINLYQMPR